MHWKLVCGVFLIALVFVLPQSGFGASADAFGTVQQKQIKDGIATMEKIMGCKFGDTKKMPLLVAVRSGARDSMTCKADEISLRDAWRSAAAASPSCSRSSTTMSRAS